ncbi:hypothetical protein [Candidatus Nitrosopumilus koreensis]|nr:hypothetical protein [Candidatus Nitrosopumilus koreensis]
MPSVFAEHVDDRYGTFYGQVGNPVAIHTSVNNPNNYGTTASIEYIFENIEGDNYWDTKQHSGDVSPGKSFGTHQNYFLDDVGRFFIMIVGKVNGDIVQTSKSEYIIFEKYSAAALNGCAPERELVVKPDYSKAVCVFEESVLKLVQRGWVAKTIFSDEPILDYYKTLPEVVAFYSVYDDADVLFDDNILSYFAGDGDNFSVRMNLNLDQNHNIKDISFHCYAQRVHQTDVAQENILNFLGTYTCDETGVHKNN